jgi:hypothetical protein
MATSTANYMELVWRKPGEERSEWTPKPSTEKKALLGNAPRQLNTGIANTDLVENSPHEGVACPQARVGGVGEHPPNKRETACAKMNERYLVGQAIQNPFMPNNDYARDIEMQMNFLTPAKG